MEAIPVEVIGNILSHVASARDVALASAVCRKWRDAARRHLRALTFSSSDWPRGPHLLPTRDLEVLITETILRTPSLARLSLSMPSSHHDFSPAPVIAWLLVTRDTLLSLTYMIRVDPEVNVIDRCGRHRLEHLALGYLTIPTFDPGLYTFPLLRSLTLKRVNISSSDINLLLSACPVLEDFALVNSDPTLPELGSRVIGITCSSLRSLLLEDLNLDSMHVVVDSPELESVSVKYCTLEHLEILGRRSVRSLKMAHCNIFHLDIGEAADRLQSVDLSGFTLTWSKLHPLLLRAGGLRSLRLWGVLPEAEESVLDTETLAGCFPVLRKLSLSYDLSEGLSEVVRGESEMRSVSVLEVGAEVVNEVYAGWICALVERCPRLKRLVVWGRLSEASEPEDYQRISDFTASVVSLMRKFIHVKIQFQFY